MENVKILINPYEGINSLSVNGQPSYLYGELSNFTKEPILNWAGEFFSAAEKEINDCFNLIVVGERFDSLLFADLSKVFDACKSFESENFQVNFLVEKRLNVVKRLAEKYNIKYSFEKYKIPFWTDFDYDFSREMLRPSKINDAFIYIVKEKSSIDKILYQNKTSLVLLLSEVPKVSVVHNSIYVWEINEKTLNVIMDAVIDRFAKIPFIVDVSKTINANKYLENADKEILLLANSIYPFVKVQDIEKIEIGTIEKLNIKFLPDNLAKPYIRAESQNPDIIEVNGIDLKAKAAGETYLYFYKDNEALPFEKKKITVFKDTTVKQIILDRPDAKMGIGKTQQIKITVLPNDADDTEYVIWTVDKPEIATVSDNGTVFAKRSGRVTVTASTSKVKESVIIDILPNITKMTSSVSNIKILKGENFPVDVYYEPINCFNNNCTWITNDSNIAYVETLSDGTSYIQAKEPGVCIVSCIAEEGGCSVSCRVEVLDPQVEEEKQKKKLKGIDIACIIGIPLICITILSILIELFG